MRRLVVVIAVSMLAAGSVLGTPAHSEDGTCSALGGTDLSPTKTYDLPDGGTAYEYVIGGVTNTYPVPPADFVPLKATDEELAEYGLPPRPADITELTSWESEMALLKGAAVPSPCLIPSVAGLHQPAPPDGTEPDITTSYNWSGYLTNDQGVNHWDWVQGDWTQPTAQNTCTDDYEFTWVGLGGFYNPPGKLMQAGTIMHHATGYPYAVYEYVNNSNPNPAIALPNVDVSSGDSMHAEVGYISDGTGDFFVVDHTNGTFQTVLVTVGSSYYDGSTGDFIDERPVVNGSLKALRKYVTANWTNTKVKDATPGSWQSLGSQTHKRLKMVANNGTTVLSKPDPLSSNTTFTDQWKACGP